MNQGKEFWKSILCDDYDFWLALKKILFVGGVFGRQRPFSQVLLDDSHNTLAQIFGVAPKCNCSSAAFSAFNILHLIINAICV